jgi:hypothetical protein
MSAPEKRVGSYQYPPKRPPIVGSGGGGGGLVVVVVSVSDSLAQETRIRARIKSAEERIIERGVFMDFG